MASAGMVGLESIAERLEPEEILKEGTHDVCKNENERKDSHESRLLTTVSKLPLTILSNSNSVEED